MKNRRKISEFKVGDEINPESHNVRLKITAVYPKSNTAEAEVTKAIGIFSTDDHDTPGCHQDGFKVGMKLRFRPSGLGDWNPEDITGAAKNLPWFVLMITEDGQKLFVHYL